MCQLVLCNDHIILCCANPGRGFPDAVGRVTDDGAQRTIPGPNGAAVVSNHNVNVSEKVWRSHITVQQQDPRGVTTEFYVTFFLGIGMADHFGKRCINWFKISGSLDVYERNWYLKIFFPASPWFQSILLKVCPDVLIHSSLLLTNTRGPRPGMEHQVVWK